MALSISRNIKLLKVNPFRVTSPLKRVKSSHKRYKSYHASFATLTSSHSVTTSELSAQVSKWWSVVVATPFAFAAFWGASTDNKNNVESLVVDAEKFDKLGDATGSENQRLDLARKMIASVRSMSAEELQKHPALVVQIVTASVGQLVTLRVPDAESAVSFLNQLSRRLDLENKSPDVLRMVYRIIYTYHLVNQQLEPARKILLDEVDLVRKIEKTVSSPQQTDLLLHAAVLSLPDASHVAKYLKEGNKVFDGITAATLTPDLEDYWRLLITKQLQISLACEQSKDHESKKVFGASSYVLYERLKQVSRNKLPSFSELEARIRLDFDTQAQIDQMKQDVKLK